MAVVKGIDKLMVDLDKIEHQKYTEVLKFIGLEVERKAVDIVPVDTGRLKASISTEVVDDDTVETGPNASPKSGVKPVEYAVYVEYGTYKMAAQPYMRPAAEYVRKKYRRFIK